MSFTYSEYVSVAIVIQHALRMRHVVTCGLFGSTMFPHYCINRTIFENKVIEFHLLYNYYLKHFSF